jgi:hypothetical protein
MGSSTWNNLILLPTNKWFCLLDIGIQVVVLKGLQLSQQLKFVVRFREYPAPPNRFQSMLYTFHLGMH